MKSVAVDNFNENQVLINTTLGQPEQDNVQCGTYEEEKELAGSNTISGEQASQLQTSVVNVPCSAQIVIPAESYSHAPSEDKIKLNFISFAAPSVKDPAQVESI